MRTSTFALGLSLLMAAPALAAGSADKDVLAAMDGWKQAMIKKDRAGLEKVFHPDLTYGHSSGTIETKAQAIQHVVGATASYVAINFADTKVQVHGNTALVIGKVDYQERAKDKDTTVNLVVLSVWTKTPAGWQMIARQATKPTPPHPPSPPAPPSAPVPPAH
jgi:ketosteroid isomerase-like protein